MVPNFTQEPQLVTVLVQDDSVVDRYPVGLGNTVIIINFNTHKFWIKTNPNGFPPPPRVFNFDEITPNPIQPEDGVTRDEFNTLSAKLDKLITELGGGNK